MGIGAVCNVERQRFAADSPVVITRLKLVDPLPGPKSGLKV